MDRSSVLPASSPRATGNLPIPYLRSRSTMYNLIASVVVLVIFAPILGLILKRFSVHEQKYIFIAFLAHIVATLAQVWIHLYYYGYGDMVTYFREGTAVAELLRHDFWHYAPQLLQAVFHQ